MRKLNKLVAVSALAGGILLSSSVASAAEFKDLGNNFWAQDEINYLTDNEIINGFPDGAFQPNKTITKAEAAVIIVRALKLPINKNTPLTFTDVSKSHSAYKEIATAVEAGIFPKANKFNPNDLMTRELTAEAIVNAFKLKGGGSIRFDDVPSTSARYKAISILAENDITTGTEAGKFKPKEKVTRAQFSVFIARALNSDFLPSPDIPMNVNPVVKLFDFVIKNPKKIKTLFVNENDLGFTKYSSGIQKLEVLDLTRVAQLKGETEFKVTVKVKTANKEQGLLKDGEYPLYFLVKRNGFMDYKIKSVDKTPLLKSDDTFITSAVARSIFSGANLAYWYVVSGGEGNRDLTVFKKNNIEYRYLGETLNTEEKLKSYLGKWYTPEQTNKLFKDLGFITNNGKLAQPNADGGSLADWNKAILKLTKNSTTSKTYEMKVPLGDLGIYETEKGELSFVAGKGWRVQSVVPVQK